MSSSQPVTPPQPKHNWVNLLAHIGEVGVESVAPFADGIGNLVNALAPGAGPSVAALIKAVSQAESEAHQTGRDGAGSAKLSMVLTKVSPQVSGTLAAHGQPSSTDAVTNLVNQTVATLKALQVPSTGTAQVIPKNPVAPAPTQK